MQIELIYIDAKGKIHQDFCHLQANAKVADALKLSGFLQKYPEAQGLTFGIFSDLANEETLLNDGDRIEFYRPLLIDPKEKRRLRAKVKKS